VRTPGARLQSLQGMAAALGMGDTSGRDMTPARACRALCQVGWLWEGLGRVCGARGRDVSGSCLCFGRAEGMPFGRLSGSSGAAGWRVAGPLGHDARAGSLYNSIAQHLNDVNDMGCADVHPGSSPVPQLLGLLAAVVAVDLPECAATSATGFLREHRSPIRSAAQNEMTPRDDTDESLHAPWMSLRPTVTCAFVWTMW
jgi:hypothetical protein